MRIRADKLWSGSDQPLF